MTLRELAEEAGVSISTASKAFRNSKEISPETRDKIFKIAEKHGCFYKYYKKKYEKRMVAVICPEIRSSYYSEQVEYIQQKLQEKNIVTMIATDQFDTKRQQMLLEFFAEHAKVDGVIILQGKLPVPKGIEIPVVTLNVAMEEERADARNHCHIPLQKAMDEAVYHLRELGHTHVAFISEPLTTGSLQCFGHSMKKYRLTAHHVTAEGRFEEAGINGVRKLLENRLPCTALICAYDNMAIGAIKELKRHGFRVPEDYSVIGINNIPTAEYLDKGLTTIDQAYRAGCDFVCNLLIQKMENPYYCSNATITLTGGLIVRETTGPAKQEP